MNSIIRKNYSTIFKVRWNDSDPNHPANLISRGDFTVFNGFEVVSGHFPYGLHMIREKDTNFNYLTMLRRPVNRTVSAYNYLKNDSKYVKADQDLDKYINSLTIEEFCSDFHSPIPNHVYVDNCQVRYLSGVGDSKPFMTIDNKDLKEAKKNLSTMIFGITEQFNLSILYFQFALNWRETKYVKQKIGTKTKINLSDNDRKAIEKCNSCDFELYDFAVELFAERTVDIKQRQLAAYEKALVRYAYLSRLFNLPRLFVSRFRSMW